MFKGGGFILLKTLKYQEYQEIYNVNYDFYYDWDRETLFTCLLFINLLLFMSDSDLYLTFTNMHILKPAANSVQLITIRNTKYA